MRHRALLNLSRGVSIGYSVISVILVMITTIFSQPKTYFYLVSDRDWETHSLGDSQRQIQSIVTPCFWTMLKD